MKNNLLRRALSMVLALTVTLGMSITVFAGEKADGSVELFTFDWVYENAETYVSLVNADYEDEVNEPVINSVTLSDTTLASVRHNKYGWYIKGLKPGTLTYTVNYTLKGSTADITNKITVKELPLVFKSIKVNGKKYKPTKTKYAYGVVKKAKSATKVKVKPVIASGWKIKSAKAYAYKSANSSPKTFKIAAKTIKKGKKIKFPKKYKNMTVAITMVNKKTGKKFVYCVHFYRKKAFAKW